jgi:hypothetical protein
MSDTNPTSNGQSQNGDSLWPKDFGILPVTPPVVILRQQATLLKQMTNNVLEGIVYSDEGDYGNVLHSFYVKAPALDGYRYRLLGLSHNVSKPYPVQIIYDASSGFDFKAGQMSWRQAQQNSDIEDEVKLRDRLRDIFNSEDTLQLIRSLIAQSQTDITV